MKHTATLMLALGLCLFGQSQTAPKQQADPQAQEANRLRQAEMAERRRQTRNAIDAERMGVEVRVKDIARFRGVRSNQIHGYGLVVGLEGSGDSKKTPFTATLMANALKDFGTIVDPAQFNAKNIAAVSITAELPPYATPGNTIDVTVQSIGDAKSLQGGFLLQAPLFGASDKTKAFAVAQGAVSIGGFNVSSGGSSVQKNHVNVGRIPDGAIVESTVPYQVIFEGKLFLELQAGDITTAARLADALTEKFPQCLPTAVDGGTVQITLPPGENPMTLMSQIEQCTVMSDTPAVVVINERTGTIIIGGNVRIGPAVIAQGSLQVIIDKENFVSQPPPLSGGSTVTGSNTAVAAQEDTAQVALVGPSATVADLARIFQTLKVTPRDIIAILQGLRQQGALKARIEVQ